MIACIVLRGRDKPLPIDLLVDGRCGDLGLGEREQHLNLALLIVGASVEGRLDEVCEARHRLVHPEGDSAARSGLDFAIKAAAFRHPCSS